MTAVAEHGGMSRPHDRATARARGRLLVVALVAGAVLGFAATASSTSGAPPSAAKDLARTYFGSTLVRAEVVSVVGGTLHDLLIDIGRVTVSRTGSFDLRERDGTQQTIRTGATTRVLGTTFIKRLPRGLRVLAVREGDGPATEIYPAAAARTLGKAFFGSTLARAEVVTFEDGTSHDFLIDEGRVQSARGGSITLLERDGRRQTIPVAAETEVTAFGALSDLTAVTRGSTVVAIRSGDSAAQEIRILSAAAVKTR
jgi:hypothetical protein